MRTTLLLIALVAGLVVAWLALTTRDADPAQSLGEPAQQAPTDASRSYEAPESERAGARQPLLDVKTDESVQPAERTDTPASQSSRVLRVLLTDGKQGAPMPGVRIELRTSRDASEAAASAVTGPDGRFETPPLPCGELSFRHAPELDDPEHALPLWIRPTELLLPEAADGAPFECTLWATRPVQVVVVDVVDANGRPAPGARVQLAFEASDTETDRFQTAGGGVTNAEGRAHVGLWGYGTDGTAPFELIEATLLARGADDTVSEVLALGPQDFRGPHRLRLGPACELEVRVRWEHGTPAASVRVGTWGPRDLPDSDTGVLRTDARGVITFGGLFPVEYTVSVQNPSGLKRELATARLWRGQRSELDIVLPEGTRRIGASGTVADEAGAPLTDVDVHYRADAGFAQRVWTDTRGHFECWVEPCTSIWIGLDVEPLGELFEPGSCTVDFGTRDLRFQRVEAGRMQRFRLHASDRANGARIEPIYLTFDRGSGTEEWCNTFAPRELYAVRATSATRCRVEAVGYVGTSFALLDALAAAKGDPPELEVALERGLSCELRVLDEPSRRPIEGATLTAPDGSVARTDSEGRARIESDRWSIYVLEASGYEPDEWDPEEGLLFPREAEYLTPVD